jgi:hypothetical protein
VNIHGSWQHTHTHTRGSLDAHNTPKRNEKSDKVTTTPTITNFLGFAHAQLKTHSVVHHTSATPFTKAVYSCTIYDNAAHVQLHRSQRLLPFRKDVRLTDNVRPRSHRHGWAIQRPPPIIGIYVRGSVKRRLASKQLILTWSSSPLNNGNDANHLTSTILPFDKPRLPNAALFTAQRPAAPATIGGSRLSVAAP